MKKFALLLLVFLLLGCGEKNKSSNTEAASPAVPSATSPSTNGDSKTIVAKLNGEPITEAELNTEIANRMARIQSQIYDIQIYGIDSIIEERLLKKEAEKRNISVEELTKLEINDKVGSISDKEVEDFYNQNKTRYGDKTLEQLKDNIKQQLIARKTGIYRTNYLDRLKDKADIQINITRPTINVGMGNSPMKGNKSAKVTIIEFTDFQCPFCGRARPIVKEIISDYGDKIRYVQRNYPLDFHPFAKKAAEAAQCAEEQGKYWEYTDLLWENQGALDIPSLKKYAADLKLEQNKFDECLDSDKPGAKITQDVTDANNAGVSGTPTFYINGQMLTGALPIEKFKEIIDEQLREAKAK